MKIKTIQAREILDSRGIPTVETTLTLDDGASATASVPSGASTGETEVLELRDGNQDRYFGKGVLKAVENVNQTLASALVDKDFTTQRELDEYMIELDGTKNKSKLGGNAILSISMAFAQAAALQNAQELYEYISETFWGEKVIFDTMNIQPMILLMEGGAHGDWSTDFQEYKIVPRLEAFPSISDAIRVGSEIFHATHEVLMEKGYSATVGFEGAYSPREISGNTEAFEIMLAGIERAGYTPGDEVMFALDIAASEFYNKESELYELKSENLRMDADEWIDKQLNWFAGYPIYSVEDPLDENDWDAWTKFTQHAGNDMQIIGDDLLTTNTERIRQAIDTQACNSVLIKLNQIGTVTETLDAIKLADTAEFTTVVSHRSGETNSSFIADLVVGTSSWQSKFGGVDRGERVAKYNRLMEIEQKIRT